MMSMEPRYASEVEAAAQQIARLKRRFARRQARRRELFPRRDARDAGREEEKDDREGTRREGAPESGDGREGAQAAIRKIVAACLLDPGTKTPIDSQGLHRKLSRGPQGTAYEAALASCKLTSIDQVIQELAAAQPPYMEAERFDVSNMPRMMILSLDKARLASLVRLTEKRPHSQSPSPPAPQPSPPPRDLFSGPDVHRGHFPPRGPVGPGPLGEGGRGQPPPRFPPLPPFLGGDRMEPGDGSKPGPDLEALLSHKSVKDRQKREKGEELIELIQKRTAKESATVEKFQTGGAAVREFCPNLTKDECRRKNRSMVACPRLHFRRLIFPWTDASLGNCSYLDTCRNISTCKYMHYELDPEPDALTPEHMQALSKPPPTIPKYLQALPEPQWVNCDVRTFDMTVLGKFGVIMADPPWEIHQDLPYGTMQDDEMRRLNIGCLQEDGVIFLWVTGRAMELGRECLEIWGYKRVDELVWVKTNQLQRLIRTGRTGHWLNHSKEHCLLGYKGDPAINRFVDCDVVVAEVRETSRKPDEMYSLLERLSPGTRKLEIFARAHNLQPGWVSLGNQLDSVCIKDPEMKARYDAACGKKTPSKEKPKGDDK
ncbi:unnamed protein product [Ostreobium quekettii]|uniref:Uncharacterized protein n=1 Tax=Ostreobium quekettii TaxID=121088 RepID=A0A8S1IVX3_9CHLO|nr:unnamed protein product [Ostreobium quekettii]|eukprot:evm.model.scf_1778.6 EVM.evm.TU.scf_1778.6   scf_1778:22438-30779(+)